ncbi:MAG: O-antigen ligase family protein [Bacteroidetes bacterium]|nr:O-antigen ligase family protein [Bacteroidota bacterium]
MIQIENNKLAALLPEILFWVLVLQLSVISISIAAGSLLLGATILLVIVWSIAKRIWIFPKTSLDYFFLAYIGIEFVTAIFSHESARAFIYSKRLLLIVIVYAVLVSFTSKEKIEKSLLIISSVTALLSLGEIIFYFSAHEERLYVFQHYMTTGGLKMMISLLLIPPILDTKNKNKKRLYYLLIFLPIFIALILTNTRSAWLGFIAGIILLSIIEYRKLFALLVFLLVLFFMIAPKHQIDRAKSIIDLHDPSNYGRLNMWTTGIKIWNDYPILGTGDIDLHELYLQYKQPDDNEYGGHLHNNYIHLLVTLGAAGFLIVMMLFGKIFHTEYKIFHLVRSDHLLKNISLGSLALFTGFLVNGMFEWNFGDHEIMVFVWFSIGLALAAERVFKGKDA